VVDVNGRSNALIICIYFCIQRILLAISNDLRIV